MSHHRPTLLTALLLALVVCTGYTAAQTVYPGVVKVYSIVEIIDITQINGVLEQYTLDLFLSWYWAEPRIPPHAGFNGVVVDPAVLPANHEVEFLNGLQMTPVFDKRRVFNTAPQVLLDVPITDMYYPQLKADLDLGTSVRWVMINSRYSGTVRSRMHLEDFPFDRQNIRIQTLSPNMPLQELELFPLQPFPFMPLDLEIIEWVRKSERVRKLVENITAFDQVFSMVEYDIVIERQPQYYVDKIIAGIVFLVVMAQIMFAFDPNDSNRGVGSMTSYVGIINYLFVVAGDVPKISQTTRLDNFIQFSFGINFANFLACSLMFLYNFWLETNQKIDDEAKQTAGKPEEEEGALRHAASFVYYAGYRHMPSARLVDGIAFMSLNIFYIVGVVVILYG